MADRYDEQAQHLRDSDWTERDRAWGHSVGMFRMLKGTEVCMTMCVAPPEARVFKEVPPLARLIVQAHGLPYDPQEAMEDLELCVATRRALDAAGY